MKAKRPYNRVSLAGKKDKISCRHALAHPGASVIPSKFKHMGDTVKKFDVYIEEFRIHIFIDDPSHEAETRLNFYERQKQLR